MAAGTWAQWQGLAQPDPQTSTKSARVLTYGIWLLAVGCASWCAAHEDACHELSAYVICRTHAPRGPVGAHTPKT